MPEEKLGSIIASDDYSDLFTYVAYGNIYSFMITRHALDKHKGDLSVLEKKYQKAELAFRQFTKELKNLGYLDDDTPIIKFDVSDKLNGCNVRFASEYSTIAYFDWVSGKVVPQNWAQEYSAVYAYDGLSDFDKVVLSLKHLINRITPEITKQGYEVDNRCIIKLIHLYNRGINVYTRKQIFVGDFKDWIPYVYAGVGQLDTYNALKKDNNPDYEKTGKIAISVETAKKLGSIHSSFAKLITSQ